MTEIHSIPEDVIRIIFKFLSTPDLCRAASLCTLWRRIADEKTSAISVWLSPVMTLRSYVNLRDMGVLTVSCGER